jgi:hypothetical protein
MEPELEVVPAMRPTPKQRILESEELIGDVLFLYDEQTGGVHTAQQRRCYGLASL